MRIDAAFAGDLAAQAVRSGADEAEVFATLRSRLSVEVKDRQVDSLSSSATSGYGLRVIRDGRLGFSSSSDPEDASRVVQNALDAARFSDPDPFLRLPDAAAASAVEVHDPAIAGLSKEDAISAAFAIEDAARTADRRIVRVRKPAATFSTSETIIASSRGLAVTAASTFCSAQITAVAEAGGESRSGWEFGASRRLSDVSFGQVGKSAADRAVRMLGSRRISGRRAAVLLDPSVVTDFLGVFAASLSAEAVQRSKSLLKGKLGTRVMSGSVSLVDSGLVPWAAGSFPFDDEGVPTSRKTLVERGVLVSFLQNTATAARDRTSSTGNASRGGFSSLPSVGVTNLFLEPADPAAATPVGRLPEVVGTGLCVTEAMGMHTVNRISGDFSIGVSGIWIENSAFGFPVKEAVIAGNLLDLFGRVAAVGDDFRWFGTVGGPSLVISDVDISG